MHENSGFCWRLKSYQWKPVTLEKNWWSLILDRKMEDWHWKEKKKNKHFFSPSATLSFHRKHSTNVLFPASISFFGPCLAFQCQICISACRNSNSKLSCGRGFPPTCWGEFGVTVPHLSYSHAVLDFNVYLCVSASVLTFELFRI